MLHITIIILGDKEQKLLTAVLMQKVCSKIHAEMCFKTCIMAKGARERKFNNSDP